MNGTWQGITQTLWLNLPVKLNGLLAQVTPVPVDEPAPARGFSFDSIFANLGLNLGSSLVDLLKAILTLVVGLIVASLVAAAVRGLLNRTNIDNRIASWVTGRQGADAPPVEKWVSSLVFWLIMLFAIVAFLQTLRLTAVAGPLNTLLEQVTQFLPKLVSAAILVGVAWLLATLVKLVVTRGLRALRIDERLGEQVGGTSRGNLGDPAVETPRTNPYALSDTLANALYWFIFLLFLPLVLDALQLQQALGPVNNLLNQILGAIPNILTAVIIGAAGWLLAQVVRRIVTNLLAATGTDRLGARFGISRATGGQSLSWLIGTVVFVLILIPTAIASLNALGIAAISVPAIAMLTQILNAIPLIFTAGLILAIAYVIGHFVSELVTNILTSIGFNNIFYWLGIQPRPSTRRSTGVLPPAVEGQTPPTGQATVLQQPTTTTTTRTPSEIVGIVALVGIMLFATLAAVQVLNIPALTALVGGIIVILGRILAGLVVFAIGLYLANLAFNLINSSGNPQARILAQAARIAIIALVSAMALQQMGIASDIVNLAFGLLLGAIAVAIALAFGLGGREIAAGQVREWLGTFKDKQPPR
ncbi:mechanosensitive ion channel [Trichocoleus sp. FACHB-90]|uniref:mechanosensitive ion channel n=1 Tax=Cyanophyceae TaxID=3028117 RepID=UPI001686F689|nr:mechanosensitive ion channel [Trichocoleus sp. FACHB-90]MBD1928430.1 mechanosensitive ion channel [Trichocoleus sp. FACHB-90]